MEWVGAIVTAVVTAIAAIYAIRRKNESHVVRQLRDQNKYQQELIDRLQERTDLIWDFQVRRAYVKAQLDVQQGGEEMIALAPCEIVPAPVLASLGVIASDLQHMYKSLKKGIADSEAMLEIERRFGDWMVHNLCIPHRKSSGECLVYALSVAKGVRN